MDDDEEDIWLFFLLFAGDELFNSLSIVYFNAAPLLWLCLYQYWDWMQVHKL